MEAPPTTELIAGKYQLIQMIGRGGMGSVWEGRHITLGNRVAIKFIESDHANSTEARQRFDNEARAAATIQSKYAIQIYDHGLMADGKPYIVMEFLSGEPLDKRLSRSHVIPLQDTARIIQHVSRGLGRAHERGIIHRDLKPENIFLCPDEDEGGEIAKVLDFGIAKINSDSLSISSNTKTGAILGTPYFMSPEQARGLKNIDHRSDIWSLGVIAYRCVTGRLPFDGESVGDLLVKICVAPLPVPSELNPHLPHMFNAWFARCLDREPEKRFATVQECAIALAQLSGITARGSLHSGQLRPITQAIGPSPAPYMQIPSYNGGTPLPAARATAAGLSSSTSSLQQKSNRGALAAIGGAFLLLGIGGAAIAIAKFSKKEEPPIGIGIGIGTGVGVPTATPVTAGIASSAAVGGTAVPTTEPIATLQDVAALPSAKPSSSSKKPGTTPGGVPYTRPSGATPSTTATIAKPMPTTKSTLGIGF
jgi:eukaryotic-like serine/threonine-protein kinase